MSNIEILIPNLDGRQALELCIESIARFTTEPHRVTVYDDGSTNPGELIYLEKAKQRGWVDRIIDGKAQQGHGAALNHLFDAVDPATDYAIVVDNDIQILNEAWLSALVREASKPDIWGIVDTKAWGLWPRGYHPPIYLYWLGLVNMAAWRDGMSVNWISTEEDRSEEPWLSYFAPHYPPERVPLFKYYLDNGWLRSEFRDNIVMMDPGSQPWKVIEFYNPKGYRVVSLPPHTRQSFRHFGHAQEWLNPVHNKTGDNPNSTPDRPWGDFGLNRFREYTETINAQLRALRGG